MIVNWAIEFQHNGTPLDCVCLQYLKNSGFIFIGRKPWDVLKITWRLDKRVSEPPFTIFFRRVVNIGSKRVDVMNRDLKKQANTGFCPVRHLSVRCPDDEFFYSTLGSFQNKIIFFQYTDRRFSIFIAQSLNNELLHVQSNSNKQSPVACSNKQIILIN